MTKIISVIIVLVMIAIAIGVSIVNMHNIQVNYYIGSKDVPLVVVLLVTLLIGGLIGIIATYGRVLMFKLEAIKLRHRNKINEKEISNLRAMPIKGAR